MEAQQIIDAEIQREGSEYTNRPGDRGGPTKFGITLNTLASWRGHLSTTAADVEALTETEARAIYDHLYVQPFAPLAGISAPLLGLLVDSGVQHGPDRAIKWLQTALGVVADGDLGPKTILAWGPHQQNDDMPIYKAVLKTRIKFYAHIIHDDPSQTVNANGWFNRICEFIV
jgi:lysozyme family protein